MSRHRIFEALSGALLLLALLAGIGGLLYGCLFVTGCKSHLYDRPPIDLALDEATFDASVPAARDAAPPEDLSPPRCGLQGLPCCPGQIPECGPPGECVCPGAGGWPLDGGTICRCLVDGGIQ